MRPQRPLPDSLFSTDQVAQCGLSHHSWPWGQPWPTACASSSFCSLNPGPVSCCLNCCAQLHAWRPTQSVLWNPAPSFPQLAVSPTSHSPREWKGRQSIPCWPDKKNHMAFYQVSKGPEKPSFFPGWLDPSLGQAWDGGVLGSWLKSVLGRCAVW